MLASRAEGRYLRLGEPANPPPGPGINYIRRSFAHTLVKPAVSVLRKRPPHALAYLLVRRSRTVAGFGGEGGGQGQERGSGHTGEGGGRGGGGLIMLLLPRLVNTVIGVFLRCWLTAIFKRGKLERSSRTIHYLFKPALLRAHDPWRILYLFLFLFLSLSFLSLRFLSLFHSRLSMGRRHRRC